MAWHLSKVLGGRGTTSEQNREGRRIARKSWIAAEGDMAKAKQLAKAEVHEQYGSIILAITLAAAILQICYTLFKFWQATHCVNPPETPPVGVEPFSYE